MLLQKWSTRRDRPCLATCPWSHNGGMTVTLRRRRAEPRENRGSGGGDGGGRVRTGAPNTGAPNTGAPNTGAPNTGAPNTGAPNTGATGDTARSSQSARTSSRRGQEHSTPAAAALPTTNDGSAQRTTGADRTRSSGRGGSETVGRPAAAQSSASPPKSGASRGVSGVGRGPTSGPGRSLRAMRAGGLALPPITRFGGR
jgi:hypothetical protein